MPLLLTRGNGVGGEGGANETKISKKELDDRYCLRRGHLHKGALPSRMDWRWQTDPDTIQGFEELYSTSYNTPSFEKEAQKGS